MKRLAIISLTASVLLSGCAHYGYQRGYTSYGGGYSSGYTSGGYAYPSSGYYMETIRPGYVEHYRAPYSGGGGRHHDWDDRDHDRPRHNPQHRDGRQHFGFQNHRHNEGARLEAERVQRQRVGFSDRNFDGGRQPPEMSNPRVRRFSHDVGRSHQDIRRTGDNDAHVGGKERHHAPGGRDNHNGHRQNR